MYNDKTVSYIKYHQGKYIKAHKSTHTANVALKKIIAKNRNIYYKIAVYIIFRRKHCKREQRPGIQLYVISSKRLFLTDT